MSTYAAMRQDFINLLNRTDFSDPNAALVKQWFNSSIQLIEREVRARFMETVLVIDTSGGQVSTLAVPTDWLETKAFVWDNGADADEIDKVELGTYYKRKNETFNIPAIYTREGSSFFISGPISLNATAKLIYYAKLTPLVNDADEPAYAAQAPDLVVRGALVFAGTHFTDDRKPTWQDEFQFLREQVQTQASESDNSSTNAISPTQEYDDGV
jgi:hypothetical protein